MERSSRCTHLFFNGDFVNGIERTVREEEVRELRNFAKKALETSYDEIHILKQKCKSQRDTIAELEIKLQSLKDHTLNLNKSRHKRNKSGNSSSSEDEDSSLGEPQDWGYCNLSRQKAQMFKNSILKIPFLVPASRNHDENRKERSVSWRGPTSRTSHYSVKDKVAKSRKSLRQSLILRNPPSELQITLRKQLEAMEQEKVSMVKELLLKRKQKQFAIDTLMRMIELHSQTLQILMQKHQEGLEYRPSELSKSIKRFNAIQKQEQEISEIISRKLGNIKVIETVIKNLKILREPKSN